MTEKNKQMAREMRELEALVKEKLRSGWNSVRKAFLELDLDFDAKLSAEELFKVFGPQSAQVSEETQKGDAKHKKADYEVLRMLMNVRFKSNKINFTQFCQWFGAVIEPNEDFYFRHDSTKNP